MQNVFFSLSDAFFPDILRTFVANKTRKEQHHGKDNPGKL
jgi:hypothetical protein